MNDTAILPPSASLTTTARRTLAPTTFTEALEFAKQLAQSSMVPAEYRGRPENIVLAMQWGLELGLAPLQAIQSIAVINGKPSVYGDALIAMVRGSPVCEDVIEHFEGSGEEFTAVCEARRKGKAPIVARFSVADAKAAKLWGKQGPWQQYPRRMMQMRARGFALRDAFPDVLRGVITREEAEDYPVDVSRGRQAIDVTPRADLDRFAAALPAQDFDQETGEIIDADAGREALIAAAKGAAGEGTEAFRAWWKTITKADRDVLRPDLPTYQQTAEKADAAAADAARQAEEADDDPFAPAPTSGAPPATSRASGDGSVATMDAATANLSAGHGPTAMTAASPFDERPDMLGTTLFVPLPRNPMTGDWAYWRRQIDALLEEQPSTTDRTRVKLANKLAIDKYKVADYDGYQTLMAALSGRG